MQEVASMGHATSDEAATTSSQLKEAQNQPSWSVEAVRGRRPRMEDAYCYGTINISCPEGLGQQVAIAGCFDGHGGDCVAKYMARNIPGRICSRLAGSKVTAGSVAAALSAAFTCLDQELQTSKQACLKGSTALVALVTRSLIHISSCGDSRAIICHNGEAIQPVQDHTPVREDEQERIRQAGGHVLYHNGPRVMGALAMSRAIGDHALRPYGVIADPDVAHYERRPGDDFLLLASDGLWAVMSNQDAVRLVDHAVAELSSAGMSRQQITTVLPKLLIKVALARGSSDNVTVLVMDLQADSNCPRCSSNGSGASTAAAVEAGRQDTPAAAAAVAPPEIRTGTRCSVTDNDVTVTAAAVERMRDIIKAAAAGAWDSSTASAVPNPVTPNNIQQQQQQQTSTKSLRTAPAAHKASAAKSGPFGDLVASGVRNGSAEVVQQRVIVTSSPPIGQWRQQQQVAAAAICKTILPISNTAPCASPPTNQAFGDPTPDPVSETSPFTSVSAQLGRQRSVSVAEPPAHNDQRAAVTPTAADMETAFSSPFLSHQHTILTEVWQDWTGMQASSSGSDNSNISSSTGSRCGCCFGLVGSCQCTHDSIVNPRKRRMVTTECPSIGRFSGFKAGAGLVAGNINSAPGKLQCVGSESIHSPPPPAPVARVTLPILQQRWQAAAATQAPAQLAMSAVA